MTSSQPNVILGVAGLPASGKNTFGEVAAKMGFKVSVMGDVIRNECKRLGLEINRENSNKIMLSLRDKYGKDAIARLSKTEIQDIINHNEKYILIDGIRSWSEVQFFRRSYPNLKLVGIHASPENRYQRVNNRARIDDSASRDEFKKRDQIELRVGIGSVISRVDYLIISPDTISEAEKIFREFLQHLLKQEVIA